ncbi:hypothetical protein F2Q68_00004840 [Brassica cretica]|uniref:Pentacotripeptide-repeat region of PRORP domain-containing protein n=1 Tax=Brassica cretica TaxID=69181 RepID=A0A8S9J4K7_BRACR|nr:hypothetical protein F2Q68_00004840 [Brassica cretica]
MKSSGWSQNHVTFVGVLTAFDLLARAGHLDEAVKLINEMKLEPDVVVWKTLLYMLDDLTKASIEVKEDFSEVDESGGGG